MRTILALSSAMLILFAALALDESNATPVCADLDGDGRAETCGPDPDAPNPQPGADPVPTPVCPYGQEPVAEGAEYVCRDICSAPEVYEGGQCVTPKPECSEGQYEEGGVCKDKPVVEGDPIVEP